MGITIFFTEKTNSGSLEDMRQKPLKHKLKLSNKIKVLPLIQFLLLSFKIYCIPRCKWGSGTGT